jgi:hypothetical protein
MLPGSDSHYFRGLNEYFIRTKDLNPLKPSHEYFQWPSFFLLSDVVTSVSGLGLANFEFLLYAIIGFLLVSALYVYTTSSFKNGGFTAVVSLFIGMFYFLNYQCVPFSLAFGMLFLLFMLETKLKSLGIALSILVLYTGISFTHVFVPLFFVLYLLIRCILGKSRRYGSLFITTLVIYLTVQIIQAPFSFTGNIKSVITLPSEYLAVAEATLQQASVPLDAVAQIFSRVVTIITLTVCFAGFVALLIKKKVRELDKAIFLTGVIYSVYGSIFYTLGSRAIPIAFIPISLGAAYLLESKFGPYLKGIFLFLLILFPFIPLHGSFYDSQIMFQTKEAYYAENFMIEQYNWANPGLILAHYRVITYLQTKQPSLASFEDDAYSPLFPRLKEYDTIVYTVGLGKNLLRHNYTTERILHEEMLNTIYNNGLSYIATRG